MRFSYMILAVLGLAGTAILMNSCGSSPTAPAPTATPVPPTATNTACMVGGNTCTYTATNTTTDTATVTDTQTATNSPTLTNTPTQTMTPTLTMTPTQTLSPTNTLPPTNTGTPTNSPTITNTVIYTATLCPTQVFTNTPGANGYSISGNVDYTPGGVSAAHPIEVAAFDPSVGGNNPAHCMVTTNNSTYTINGLADGTSYMVVAAYGAAITGFVWNPPVGSYAALYGTSGCASSSAQQIVVTGAMSGKNISFGTSNVLNGFEGKVYYQGSLGNVDGCHGIIVESFAAGTGIGGVNTGNNNGDSYINTNGGVFNLIGGSGEGVFASAVNRISFFIMTRPTRVAVTSRPVTRTFS